MYSGSVLEKTYTSSVGAQEPSASWRLWRGAAGSSSCRSCCCCCCVPAAAAAAAAPSLAGNPPDLLLALPLALPLTAAVRGEAGERCSSSRPVHSAQQSSSAAAAAASVRMDGDPPLGALVYAGPGEPKGEMMRGSSSAAAGPRRRNIAAADAAAAAGGWGVASDLAAAIGCPGDRQPHTRDSSGCRVREASGEARRALRVSERGRGYVNNTSGLPKAARYCQKRNRATPAPHLFWFQCAGSLRPAAAPCAPIAVLGGVAARAQVRRRLGLRCPSGLAHSVAAAGQAVRLARSCDLRSAIKGSSSPAVASLGRLADAPSPEDAPPPWQCSGSALARRCSAGQRPGSPTTLPPPCTAHRRYRPLCRCRPAHPPPRLECQHELKSRHHGGVLGGQVCQGALTSCALLPSPPPCSCALAHVHSPPAPPA